MEIVKNSKETKGSIRLVAVQSQNADALTVYVIDAKTGKTSRIALSNLTFQATDYKDLLVHYDSEVVHRLCITGPDAKLQELIDQLYD